jgi:hypothetical protein
MRRTLGIDLSRERALAAIATTDDVRLAYDDEAVVGLAGGEVIVGSRASVLGERDRCAGFFDALGRPEPFIIAGAPYGAEALVAQLLRSAVDAASKTSDEAADGIALSFPDELNAYQLDLLSQAARLAGVGQVHFVPNSVAQGHAPASSNGAGLAEGAALWLLQSDRAIPAGVPAPAGTAPSARVALLGAAAAAGATSAGASAAAAATSSASSMADFGGGRSMSDFADGKSMSDFGDGKEMSDFGGGRSMGDFATPKPGRARLLVATATTVVVAVVAAFFLLRGDDAQPVVQATASDPTTTAAPTTTTAAPVPPPASGAFAVNATITAINTPPGTRGPQAGQAGAGTLNLVCEGTTCRGSVFSSSLQLAPVAFTGTIVDGVLTSSIDSPISGDCPGTMTEIVKLTFDGDRVTGEASESPNPERCAGTIHVAFTYTFEGTRTS